MTGRKIMKKKSFYYSRIKKGEGQGKYVTFVTMKNNAPAFFFPPPQNARCNIVVRWSGSCSGAWLCSTFKIVCAYRAIQVRVCGIHGTHIVVGHNQIVGLVCLKKSGIKAWGEVPGRSKTEGILHKCGSRDAHALFLYAN